jgi:hypothetical protein
MSIRHKEILIDENDPFLNCRLGRKKYAEVLTQIVRSHHEGFVLAINNEWGAGKTTFVKMWEQQLKNEGFKTIYFNVWENDFDINPMAAILAELKKLISDGNQISYNSLLKKGAILVQNILPSVIKGVSKRYIDTEVIINALEGAAKGGTEILKSEIENYSKKQKGFKEFREELEKYVSENIETRPLVFIIDEIDRCRPDFAVEVLEKMKHFFSVPGIVFVLSIDKKQLENAIRGFYGSEQLDAAEYLRRFIDVEYVIPIPLNKEFCNYLFDYYGFADFFQSKERSRYDDFRGEKQSFLDFAEMLSQDKNLTLRQQEKLFAHARLSLKTFEQNNYVFPAVYMFLIYLFSYHKNVYSSIRARSLSLQQFVDEIEKILPQNEPNKYSRFLLHILALLLFFYHRYFRQLYNESILVQEERGTNKNILTIKSRFEPSNDTWLLNLLESFQRGNSFGFGLDFLINRIDLTENIKN